MSALLDSLRIDRVRRNVVAQMTVLASDDLKDITAKDRISTNDESASFGLRILQSIDLRNCHVSHVDSCVFCCWSGNAGISAIQNLAHKGLRRVSMLGEGRSSH